VTPARIAAFTLAAVAATAAAWALWPAATPAVAAGGIPHDDAAAVARGKPLYAAHCAACHGADLAGQPNWRVPDAEGFLPAPPHDASGHTWHHPDDQLFAITKLGTAALVGGDYRTRMIGFGEVLSDDDILAVLAYVKSTWPPGIIARHDQINASR